jgi:hypothetical protein
VLAALLVSRTVAPMTEETREDKTRVNNIIRPFCQSVAGVPAIRIQKKSGRARAIVPQPRGRAEREVDVTGDPSRRKGRSEWVRATGMMTAAVVILGASRSGVADVQPLTQDGVPYLPVPVFPETGLPKFVMPVGNPSLLPSDSSNGRGRSSGDEGGSMGGTSADELMSSRSWGPLAGQNAESIGVSSTALAATCMMESGCQNLGTSGASSASGVFQMTNATYLADIQQVVQQHPILAASIDTSLAGKMDPGNQAFASARDLKNAAVSLQQGGVANPTFLDTRAYYQWGAGAGPVVARANDSQNIYDLLSPYYSAADLANNRVTPSMTVGQWRQRVVDSVGSAASQPVLI